MVAAGAVVSALAILFTAPAQALYIEDSGIGNGPVPTATVGNPGDSASASQPASVSQIVGNPGDSASVAQTPNEQPTATSGGGTDFDRAMLIGIGGGVVLAVGLGALLFTVRHRRVALP
jgi:hypothetical protein